MGTEEAEQMFREGGGLVQEHPTLLGIVGAGCPEYSFLALLAKALEGGERTLFKGAEVLDVRDPELPPQASRGAGADAGQAGDLDQPGRYLFEEVTEDLGGAIFGEVLYH